ncbi:MAG TPA: dihydrofolate reductase family protein [Motilibacterales bacterium]|nr:dihydrofolate reductase family protein [Motilibacterales bacterium]
MIRLSVFIATSIDGYIASVDGSLDWLEEATRPDEDYGYDAFLASVDALAMGRGTYNHIAHLDPLPFRERPVFVFTHQAPEPRAGVTFCGLTPREALARWTDLGLERVYVDGGQVISAFLAEDLIDDLILTTAPVLLGAGRPLFHPGGRSADMKLDDVRSWPSGFVTRTYRRAQAPPSAPTPR